MGQGQLSTRGRNGHCLNRVTPRDLETDYIWTNAQFSQILITSVYAYSCHSLLVCDSLSWSPFYCTYSVAYCPFALRTPFVLFLYFRVLSFGFVYFGFWATSFYPLSLISLAFIVFSPPSTCIYCITLVHSRLGFFSHLFVCFIGPKMRLTSRTH